ncbi:phosphatidylinositol 4-phosphate 5-kinase D3 (PIPK-D3/GPCR-PIPK) [Thraustotheca clavata]|uniref:Phosphatidylinositol 4-phosphate 5-kinase D3 (PIPK-D3/GPCR-PIPK) n=1 Tax=Thraustotheca clavata TaxID=74557 RepID=A0A1V9YW07_9STRA|nr:phosphatidylinositol 4-phosphate 5-kinase D3 (PIPK-D3/GPCR-PIPK) [Thraustotheca clavata]
MGLEDDRTSAGPSSSTRLSMGSTVTIFRSVLTMASLLGCFFVVVSYLLFMPLRKSPSNLVLWMALLAMAMHLSFILQTGFDMAAMPTFSHCNAIGTTTEFFVVVQELYLAMMTVDLYITTRNPFSYFRTAYYHGIVGTTGALWAYIFSSDDSVPGPSPLGVCWFNADNPNAYVYVCIYLVAPLAMIYGVGFMLFIVARNRINDGYDDSSTSAARKLSLGQMKIYVGVSAMFWFVLGIGTLIILYGTGLSSEDVKTTIYSFWSLILASKGLVIACLYCHIMSVGSVIHMWRIGDYDPLMKIQGVNWVLRRDVLFFARMGICESLRPEAQLINDPTLETSKYAMRTIELVGRSDSHKALFRDYDAESFDKIRQISEISTESYIMSMSAHTRERFSEGKSGAFLYFTGDQRFILKTCTQAEQLYLLQILPQYMRHLTSFPNSFLSRYVGCYELVVYDQTIRFIVLANVMQNPSVDVDEFFDLKGSYVGRYDDPTVQGVRKVCKYCGMEFVVGMTQEMCKMNPFPNQGHTQERCGKDLNWASRQISLDNELAEQIASQLHTDSEFLRSINSIDYSLMVGLHTVGGPRPPQPVSTTPETPYSSISTPQTTREDFEDGSRPIYIKDDRRDYEAIVSPDSGSASNLNEDGNHQLPMLRSKESSNDKISLTQTPETYQQRAEDCVVYLGIIDILTPWSIRKQLEHWFRVYLQCKDRNGISCVDPRQYANRFRDHVVAVVIQGKKPPPMLEERQKLLGKKQSRPLNMGDSFSSRSELNFHTPPPPRAPTMVASDFTGSHMVMDLPRYSGSSSVAAAVGPHSYHPSSMYHMGSFRPNAWYNG